MPRCVLSRRIAVLASPLLLLPAMASAQLRIASWNISFYDGTDRASAIQTSVYGSFNGRSMSPDVLLVQEVDSAAAMNTLLSVLNTASGSPGDWAAGPYFTGPDSQGVMYYRTSKVQLVSAFVIAAGSTSTSDQPRNTERFDIRPVGYSGAGATLAMYNTHMKAGSTSTDNDRRLIETTRIRSNAEGADTNSSNGVADGLPAGWQFLLAGDFNMQTSTQTSYVELVGSQANNTGRFFDPINTPGSWNNNSAFRFVHTQDPIGAGGMDDRHDQILLGGGLVDGVGFDYVGNPSLAYSTTTWNDPNHSYRSWGNDGSSYNTTLAVSGNAMVGPVIAQALIDACSPSGGTAAGHLPVFLDLYLPPEISVSTTTINFGSVPVGSTANQVLNVSNGGNTTLFGANGIASLSYSMVASAGFTAPGGSFSDAAGGGVNPHTISMNTSTPGTKTGTITITSNSPDEPTRVINLTGTVTASNLPPVANAGPDQTVNDSNNSGNEPVTLNGSSSSDPDGTITNYRWAQGTTTLANGASSTANITLPVGTHTITLTVTDNGGLTANDTVVIKVNRPPTVNAGSDVTVTDNDNSGSETVALSGSASDLDGTIASLIWREGTTILGTGSNLSTPLSVGVHTITLTAVDNNGASSIDSVVVTVEAAPCPADWNNDGSVDGDDVILFFSEWDIGNADYNNDGSTDGDDVIQFFSNWDASC